MMRRAPTQSHPGPKIGAQVGSSEDALEVYRGGVDYPLDATPIWRYLAKDALSAPRVEALEQFRKLSITLKSSANANPDGSNSNAVAVPNWADAAPVMAVSSLLTRNTC